MNPDRAERQVRGADMHHLIINRSVALAGWCQQLRRDIAAQIAENHRLVAESHALIRKTENHFAWTVGPSHYAAPGDAVTRVEQPHSAAVARLVSAAERAARETPDPIEALVDQIRSVMADAVDPYLLVGALLEGIVQTLMSCIPLELREATMAATLALLRGRLEQDNAR